MMCIQKKKLSPWKALLETYDKKLNLATICILATLVLNMLFLFAEREIFGHDDLSQIHGYGFFLSTEGRWVNWLLFPVLKYFSTPVALGLDMLLLGISGYYCARDWGSKYKQFQVGLLTILLPSMALFLDWPIIALPAIFLLAIASIVKTDLPPFIYFCLFGVLFNATYSNIYFLLPLFFLKEGPNELVRIIVYWFIGYIIGFAIAEIATYILCGQFIHLAEFRKPNYVSDWSSFCENVRHAYIKLHHHFSILGNKGILLTLLLIGTILLSIKKEAKKTIAVVIISGFVAVSIYAQSLPAGIAISIRTAHCLYFALFLLGCWCLRSHKILFCVFTLYTGGMFFHLNGSFITYQNSIKNAFYADIKKINVSPREVKGVIVISSDDDIKNASEEIAQKTVASTRGQLNYNLDYWAATSRKAGFKNILIRHNAINLLSEENIDLNHLNFTTCGIYQYALDKNYLIIGLNPKLRES